MASSLISADHLQLSSLAVDQPFLPDEMILQIFSHLNLQDFTKCFFVSRKFSALAINDDLVLKKVLQHMTPFGKEEWETYFGKVGEAPQVPALKVLKEIYKTHMLVLLPKTVDGKPLTLNLFKTLAKKPKGGGQVTFIFINNSAIVVQHGYLANVTSRWVLFPKVILDGTRGKAYEQQIQIVAAKGKDYEVTHLFDAVVSIASRHVQLGERLFSDCHTHCQETINIGHGDWQLVVGGFGHGGLGVNYGFLVNDYDECGVAAVRK